MRTRDGAATEAVHEINIKHIEILADRPRSDFPMIKYLSIIKTILCPREPPISYRIQKSYAHHTTDAHISSVCQTAYRVYITE